MDSFQSQRPGRGLNLPNEKDGSLIKAIFDLLDKGENEIKLHDDYKNIILILGNLGTGNSTFTQWMTEDHANLLSKEVEESTEEYVIKDNNRFDDTAKNSGTTFPELVVDRKTNISYYICPAFMDKSRSASNDITTAYFTKKVLDHAESIKIIFTITYSTVKKGESIQDFMQLVRYITEFVKDIEKFRDSIAVVVTDVDNQYIKEGNNSRLLDDNEVHCTITDFIQEAKDYLEENLTIPNISEKDRKNYKDSKKFIDIILEKNGERYRKIVFFWKSEQSGNIFLLHEGKKKLVRMLNENIKFTRKDRNDFNCIISEKSQDEMSDIVEHISNNFSNYLSDVSQQIVKYFTYVTERIRIDIKSFTDNLFTNDMSLSETKIFSTELNNGYSVTSDIIKEINNLTDIEQLSMKISNIATSSNINVPEESIMHIEKGGKYLNFLSSVTIKAINSRPWEELFESTLTYISESKKIVRDEMNEAAAKINSRIQSDLDEIAGSIQEHHKRKIQTMDIQQLPDTLAKDFNSVTKTIKQIGNLTNVNELVKTIHDCTNMLDIILPKESMIDITNQSKYLEILKNLGKEELDKELSAWACPFQTIAKYLQESQIWYTFLNALYEKFSESEIQAFRLTNNVASVEDWGKTVDLISPKGTQGIKITSESYEEFLNKIANYNVTEQDNVRNITPTGLQLEEFNHVLNITLNHTIKIYCEDSTMFVLGSYVNFGEIFLKFITKNIDESCKNSSGFNGSISIFALNTVFVAEGLTKNSTAIIAPKWENTGSQIFDLSGKEGESRTEPFSFFRPTTRSKAAGGSSSHPNGADGKPGGPGGPGGCFFGIGDTFVNGGNLTIKTNGGKGGDAEHGGDAYQYIKCLQSEIPPDNTLCSPICHEIRDFKCQTITYYHRYSCKLKIFGKLLEKGINGGNGGRGGKGGTAGKITLFELSGDSGIMKVAKNGENGENGDGGKGGLSIGGDIIVSMDDRNRYWKWEETINIPYGKRGIDGGNIVGLVDPELPNIFKNPVKIVNKYKNYVWENLNMRDRLTRTRRLQFLEKLNGNNNVNSMYDTLGFIDEFEILEKQFPRLNNDIDFIPYYQSLLSRISEYAKSPKEDEKSIQYRKVLNYLYTATLGRIHNLKEDSEFTLIVNISGYLNIVKRDIETLKDLKKANNKAEIISEYRKRYKDNVDRKIEEAKLVIGKQITPELANINNEMNDKIDLLIDETIELQKKAEAEKENLERKKEELEKAMALRGLFSCLNIFSQVVSFFGPVGLAVGTVIGATTSVAESLALNDNPEMINISPTIVPDIKRLGEEIKTVREKKVVYLDKLLTEISQEISNNPKKLGDMSGKISNMKNRLNKLKENTYDLKGIKTLESELKQELKTKEGELKIKEVNTDGQTKGALKVVEKFAQAVQLGSLLVDVYNKHKSDQNKIDALTDAIEKTDNKIQKLKEYEEQIYETIVPTLQNMENNLQDVANKLETKSQVFLDVTKWKVQGALRDMKLQIQKMTEGFQVKDNLARCIEKLEEVMTTLINVYDRIQNYQDQQNLANYIADISSSSASTINISNPTLVKAINNLELLIRSNLILSQYKTALDAFKQWVFPFAHIYLEEDMLPSHLELEKNIENLVDNAVRQIEAIKSKLDMYKISVKNTDKYIHTGEFSSRYVSTEPFYVWTNDEHKDTISKLLSGQEVVLLADVKKSAPDKDAIKFSVMDIYFKSNKETLQSQIDYVIKGFDIIATHLGNSYYRYADEIYVITSDSQTIWYSCEKNMGGEPLRKNNVFDMIKEGDLMLSPYTLWEIKMINATRKISFHDLEIYKDYVDLELSGNGSYVVRKGYDLKFESNEYRSMGKYDKADTHTYIESRWRNSSECTDLNGRMVRSAHHVEGYDHYMINGAAPSLWSPLNYACNFLKMNIISNFVWFFIDQVKNVHININEDITIKRLINFGSTIAEEKNTTTEKNIGGVSSLVRNVLMKDDENSKRVCIGDYSGNFTANDRREFRKSFLLNGSDGKNNCVCFSQCLEVNCTLLLADLVARTVTGNKYKQAVQECLLSPKGKLEIRFDEYIVRSEDDVKCYLHNLSLMTERESYSWWSGVKSYAKSMFQFFGFSKCETTDDIVRDIGILFINK